MAGPSNTSVRISNYSELSIEQFELEEFLRDDVAVVVYLIFLCVVGTIGNGHAFIVYQVRYKPSNHRVFVVRLAAIDFVACAVCVPFEIVDIRQGYTFDSVVACKCFRFLNHVVSIASGLMLCLIAVERYRKACCPFKRQMSEGETKIACMVIVGISIFLSTACIYLYDVTLKFTDIPNLSGTDCTVGASETQQTFFQVYSFVLLLISTGMFILCIVAYSFIGKSLYNQMKFRQSAQFKDIQKTLDRDIENKVLDKPDAGDLHQIHEEESSIYSVKNISTLKPLEQPANKSKFPGKDRLDRTRRITFMFLIATAVSYAGYLPNLIILIIRATRPSTYLYLQTRLGMLTPVFLRGYFLSNATNPLVYCFVDERFRFECILFYHKVFRFSTGRNEV